MNSQAQMNAAQQFSSGGTTVARHESSGGGAADEDEDDIPDLEVADDDGPVDESGVDQKDIDLVMAQVSIVLAMILLPPSVIV
jgi:nascent polypeptide-associated complex subunit alpha